MKYFISDLHIGDKSTWDCFGNKKAELLIKLLERIDHHMNHRGELILLGDIFDFTMLAGDAGFPKKIDSAKIFSRVRKAYPHLFVAFREFIRAGNGLFYVWGNHDYPMRFRKHAHQFQKAVLSRWWDSFQKRPIWFSDYYISPSHSLYAEHGHRYDVTNVHINGGYMTLGSLMAVKFIKKWQTWQSNSKLEENGLLEDGSHPFQILGNIRPWPNIVYYIDRLMDQGVLSEEEKKELARDLYDIQEEAKSSMPHIFFRILESMPWFIQEGVVSSRLKDEAPRSLREKARLLLKGYSTDLSVASKRATVGSKKDLTFVPKIVVFGHTHFVEHALLEEGKYLYANTGSWQDTVFVNRQGRIMKIQDICPYLEVFPPEKYELPEAIHRRALDGKEIDPKELFKDYEKFGLTFV
jgi:UDP-2,3-diacylglucosamine pyrophosphatase LpxH